MNKPILYTYFRSSCSWRVRIALHYKGIEFESKFINLIQDGGQQLSEEYRKVNPMAQVPALQIDSHIVTQSISILEFIEEKYPLKPLLPKDLFARAQVRTVCEVIGSGIQPIQNLSVLKRIDKSHGKQEWAAEWIDKGFTALEQILKDCAGTYCVGDEITLADACLVPQVGNAVRFKVNMSKFPVISRINESLSEHPAFQAAHPFQQDDCPPQLKQE